MSDLIYLDNASTTYPKPAGVYDFMAEFYRSHGVSPGRSKFDAAVEAEDMVRGTRRMLADFLGGTDPDHLTFSYNASDSLNMVVQGVLRDGDHVVTTNLEHNSVLRPLYHLEQAGVIDVTYVPFDVDGYVDPDDVRRALRKDTRLVIMNHASNVIGTVQPIGEIGGICREAGVCFAVDASQTAGALPIDVEEMAVDILVFTGHKCLLGPTGIGGSYIKPGTPIACTRFGGTGVRSADRFHPDEFPYRMECGTLNILGVAGLRAGVEYVIEQGVENIHGREMSLWERARDGLKEIESVTLYCADTPENKIPVLSFNIEGLEAADVGAMLDVDYNIACRTGLHCAPLAHRQLGTERINGSVRLGIGPFNTGDEIDTLVGAVRRIAAAKRGRAVA